MTSSDIVQVPPILPLSGHLQCRDLEEGINTLQVLDSIHILSLPPPGAIHNNAHAMSSTRPPPNYELTFVEVGPEDGLKFCANMDQYTLYKRDCFYDHHELPDMKEELKVSSHHLFTECPYPRLVQLVESGDQEASLDVALR